MGPITGPWLKEQTKLEILTVIETSQHQGVSARRTCSRLAIEPRRVVRWQPPSRPGQPLAHLLPGPKDPLPGVLPAALEQIVTLAQSQEYVDLSHRILAVTAWDPGLFQASFSTVYRVLKERNRMTARGPSRGHNGNSKAPVRKALTGPKQRGCWDMSDCQDRGIHYKSRRRHRHICFVAHLVRGRCGPLPAFAPRLCTRGARRHL